MNKKGFTTVELIISFALTSVLLASLMTFILVYRNRVNREELRNGMVDLKNTITKTIYDDIVSDKLIKIEKCNENDKCAVFLDKDNGEHLFKVESDNQEYFVYKGLKYAIPSDVLVNNFVIASDEELSHLKVIMHHNYLNEDYEILININ